MNTTTAATATATTQTPVSTPTKRHHHHHRRSDRNRDRAPSPTFVRAGVVPPSIHTVYYRRELLVAMSKHISEHWHLLPHEGFRQFYKTHTHETRLAIRLLHSLGIRRVRHLHKWLLRLYRDMRINLQTVLVVQPYY